jgi:hypothetical protein
MDFPIKTDPMKIAERYESLLKRDDLSRDTLCKMIAALEAESAEHLKFAHTVARERDLVRRLPVGRGLVCLPLPRTLVAGGQVNSVSARAQLVFRPVRLSVAPECALYFDILDLRVGKNSQHVNDGAVSAVHFPPLPSLNEAEIERFADHLKCFSGMYDTAVAGQDISVAVRNVDEAPRLFDACLWGHTA